MKLFRTFLLLATVAASVAGFAATESGPVASLVHPGSDGRLVYAPYTPEGDTILDFSNCGFSGGGVALPNAVERIRLESAPSGDDTARIQAALDEVAHLAPGPDGMRGAVVLRRGIYRVEGTLRINASGVVLRGEGQGSSDTVVVANGKKQRPLIAINGTAPKRDAVRSTKIIDRYVPVGAKSFRVADPSGLRVGGTVFVDRLSNAAWISELGMDRIPPRPEGTPSTQWTPFSLPFDRVITAIDGNRVTVDAPIACAIDERWGGGQVVPYSDPGRVTLCGVENLRAVSAFDPSVKLNFRHQFTYAADEAHALYAVAFDHAKDCWARDVTAEHFYHGVAMIESGTKWVTVQDSTSLAPVSIIDGGRRYPFHIAGQLNLVLRCYSEEARHAFVFSARVPGPNAFVYCISRHEYATSEPHHRWSTGGLYDNVAANIAFQDRSSMGTGHGWAGANYVAWNTRGSLVVQKPPTAQNFSFGHVGPREPGAYPRPQGHWESPGQPVTPRSLYFAQLRDRLAQSSPAKTADEMSERSASEYDSRLRETSSR